MDCKKIKGFNLLELMLALVIMTSMVLLIGNYYQVTKENTKVSKAANLLNQIADANFKYLESKQPLYQQEMITIFSNMDLLPEEFSNTFKLSPWQTQISGIYHKLESSNMSFFEISIQNIPVKSCHQLMNLIEKTFGDPKSENFSCIASENTKEKIFKVKFELKGAI